jgi:hypothetical protein
MTSALLFAIGVLFGWLAHKAEVSRERERSAALGKVFER